MKFDPDAELVARVGKGDRAAAQALMARHLPEMLRLGPADAARAQAEAEDCRAGGVPEGCGPMPRAGSPGQAKFETWLYRVTLNQCYDRLQAQADARAGDGGKCRGSGPAPDAALENAGLRPRSRARWRIAGTPARRHPALSLPGARQYRSGGDTGRQR